MGFRSATALAALLCLAPVAEAMELPPFSVAHGLRLHHMAEVKKDTWRSPQNSLDSFPRHSPQDCARYGRENGYHECSEASMPRAASEPADTPETPAQPGTASRTGAARPPAEPERSPQGSRVTALPRKAPAPEIAAPAAQIAPEQVGALMILAFEGTSPDADGPRQAGDALRSGHGAGVLLRGGNIDGAAQFTALTAMLTERMRELPILMIERYGGKNDPLTDIPGFRGYASPRDIGESGDVLEAFMMYEQMASGLAAAGITLNAGPSVAACPARPDAGAGGCFGGEPRHSAAFATAFTIAHRSNGVQTALQFPLEGDTSVLAEMMKHQAPDALVVTAGGTAETNDAGIAAAIARLRATGFAGTLILDTGAGAAAAHPGTLADALITGADMTLLRRTPAPPINEVAAAVSGALRSGRLTQARLDAAYDNARTLRAPLAAPLQRLVAE